MADTFKGLVDVYGRPIEKAALKVEQAAPTSRGVRRHDALHPAAGLTPARLARLLRSSIEGDPENYLALAEDMEERDLHYSGVLGIRKRQVAGLDIGVEAAGDDAASTAAAELVREVLDRDGFEDELVDVLDAIGKGFSATEICWDTSESQWRPSRLAWRDPRWFRFDDTDGETPLLRDTGQDVPLAPYKWVFHSAKVKSGLPIRGGIARAAAWSFLFKAFTVKDWAIFCEAYGQPLRLGKYDAGASETDKDKLLEAVANIGADYAAIVPASMTVEFIEAKLSGNNELYEKRANWLDYQVSKLVLGQTGTTDAIAGGHAVGKTHDGVREDIERADARQLAATLNRDLVRAVVDLNLGPQKKYPRITIGRPQEIDVEKLVKNVVQLVPLGLKVSAAQIRDKIGLEEPAAEEELLQPSRAAAPSGDEEEPDMPPIGGKAARDAVHSKGKGDAPRDAIDRGADDALDDWEPLVGPIVAGLDAEIAAASSAGEVEQLLARRFAGLDLAALTEKLAQAAFAARLSGEVDEPLTDDMETGAFSRKKKKSDDEDGAAGRGARRAEWDASEHPRGQRGRFVETTDNPPARGADALKIRRSPSQKAPKGKDEAEYEDFGQDSDRRLEEAASELYDNGLVDPDFVESASALTAYGDNEMYQRLNSALREEMVPDDLESTIVEIDKAIANVRADRDLVVWRGVSADASPDLGSLGQGDRILDRGFVSASLSASVPDSFRDGSPAWKILVPKGSRIYPMNAMGYGRYSSEHEILLPRNSTLVVRETREDLVVMELVDEDD